MPPIAHILPPPRSLLSKLLKCSQLRISTKTINHLKQSPNLKQQILLGTVYSDYKHKRLSYFQTTEQGVFVVLRVLRW